MAQGEGWALPIFLIIVFIVFSLKYFFLPKPPNPPTGGKKKYYKFKR